MCGRTACTLSAQCIQKLFVRTVVKDGKETEVMPAWIDDPSGHKYISSYNFPPTLYGPVLISEEHQHVLKMDIKLGNKLVIQPMMWGLIPSWHDGKSNDFKLKMNNARSDGLLSKTSFKKPLQDGKRCVVICDGYYEWQTDKDGKKLPYFIYFSENSSVYKSLKEDDFKVEQIEPIKTELPDDIKEEREAAEVLSPGFIPRKLLTMAGLFDISKSKVTGEETFSYAIITVDAHEDYQFIHDRMPAILNDEKEVNDWLNFKSVPLHEAIKLIRPTNKLSCHPVSSFVNNSRQNNPQCLIFSDHKTIEITNKCESLSKSSSFMMSWLDNKRKYEDGDDKEDRKKSKLS